jgi:hypothetical protein
MLIFMLWLVSEEARPEFEGVSPLLVLIAVRLIANVRTETSNVFRVKLAKVDAFIVLLGCIRSYSSSLYRLATVDDQSMADDEARRIRTEP